MAARILLIFDDFNELSKTETYLKKTSFDVLSLKNERSLGEQLLGFRPDAIVVYGNSNRVSSFSVGKKLKDNHKYQGRVILILPAGVKLSPEDLLKVRMNAVIESPVSPEKMLKLLAKQLNLNEAALLEKLRRLQAQDSSYLKFSESNEEETDSIPVIGEISQKKPKKASKYDKFVEGVKINKAASTLNRSETKKRQTELAKDWDFDKIKEIDKLKLDFAKALFKKSK
jgi:response regulator RpfG family c-di-GMP phosphodiesterase